MSKKKGTDKSTAKNVPGTGLEKSSALEYSTIKGNTGEALFEFPDKNSASSSLSEQHTKNQQHLQHLQHTQHKKHGRSQHEVRHREPILLAIEKISTFSTTGKLTEDKTRFFDNVRYFLGAMLHLKHEFTYEEAKVVISQKQISPEIKNKLSAFVEKIPEIEYGGTEITQKELSDLNNELKGIVLSLSVAPVQENSSIVTGDFKASMYGVSYIYVNLRDFGVFIYRTAKLSVLFLLAVGKGKIKFKAPFSLLEKEYLNQINQEIVKAYDALSAGKKKEATQSYVKIFAQFNRLSLIQKQEVYAKIKTLRERLVDVYGIESRYKQFVTNLEQAIAKNDENRIKIEYGFVLKEFSLLSKAKQEEYYPALKKLIGKIKQSAPKMMSAGKIVSSAEDQHLKDKKILRDNKDVQTKTKSLVPDESTQQMPEPSKTKVKIM